MAERVSGAVTFLFTDIEGSTRLLKQLRERYPGVLSEHQRFLREAFAAHGGDEIDTQGDSFFVAFSSAREAVLAALDAQRALASHPWPDGAQVRVRVGIHTGQALVTDGRYTGLAVNRAARIGAAGHGGQVLVSQATQTLLEDEEEDLELSVRDLGEQRLKDLERPVRLYQIGAADLPASFPPLRTDAHLAEAAEVAIAPPRGLPRALVAGGAVAGVAVVALVAFLLTRSGHGGLAGVEPNNVGVIDPRTNEIVAQVPVGIRPGPIAASPGGGSIWVGDLGDRDLTRIDPKTRQPGGRIPLTATPSGLAVTNGAVWVAEPLLGRLAGVDPQYGTKQNQDVAGHISDSGSVTAGGGFVWAVYGDSSLVGVDPTNNRARHANAGNRPSGIAYGARSVWVANGGDATVLRFNASTFTSGPIGPPITVGRSPSAIAFGLDAVWVANQGDDSVTRIDPATSSQQPTAVGDGPSALAVGEGGVWVVNARAGTVSRIDPATHPPRVVRTITVGNLPAGIVVADGFVWVTVQAP